MRIPPPSARINKNSYLGQHCIVCYRPGIHNTDRIKDLAGHSHLISSGSPFGRTYGIFGTAADFVSSNCAYSATLQKPINMRAWSVLYVLYVSSGESTGATPWGVRCGASDGFYCAMNFDNAFHHFPFGTMTGASQGPWYGENQRNDNWHSCCVSYGTLGGVGYNKGRIADFNDSSWTCTRDIDSIYLNSTGSGGGGGGAYKIALLAFFDIELTNAQKAQLSLNPFSIFEWDDEDDVELNVHSASASGSLGVNSTSTGVKIACGTGTGTFDFGLGGLGNCYYSALGNSTLGASTNLVTAFYQASARTNLSFGISSASGTARRQVNGQGYSTLGINMTATPKLTIGGRGSINVSVGTSGIGKRDIYSAASICFGLSSSGSARRTTFGAGTASFGFTTYSVQFLTLGGIVTATVGINGSVNGALSANGSGLASVSLNGTSSALKTIFGMASATIPISSSGTAAKQVWASGSGSLGFTSSAEANRLFNGTANASFGFTSSASGLRLLLGTGSTSISIVAGAIGSILFHATATGIISMSSAGITDTGFNPSIFEELTMYISPEQTVRAPLSGLEAFVFPLVIDDEFEGI